MGIGDQQQHVTTIIGIACARKARQGILLVLLAVTYFSVSGTEEFKFSYFKLIL